MRYNLQMAVPEASVLFAKPLSALFPESIVNLAVAIVGGASSSGGLERHFSSLGFSYGTLRAQLGIEKAGKLAFLYRELNQ